MKCGPRIALTTTYTPTQPAQTTRDVRRRPPPPPPPSAFSIADDAAGRFVCKYRKQAVPLPAFTQFINGILSRGKDTSEQAKRPAVLLRSAAPHPRTVLQHRLQPDAVPDSALQLAGLPIGADQIDQLIRIYSGCHLEEDARKRLESIFEEVQFIRDADQLKLGFARSLLELEKIRLENCPFDELTVDKLLRIFRMGGMTELGKADFFKLLETRSFTGSAEAHAELHREEGLPRTHAPWTFFVRINGRGSLATSMIDDLLEMEKVGSVAGKIHVVALVTSDEEGGSESRSGFRLLHVTRGAAGARQVTSSAIPVGADSPLAVHSRRGRANVHDPVFLRAAIEHVKREFPSDHLLVNLWGHNSRAGTLAGAEGCEGRVLHPEEWEVAFGDLGIDILASDACRMGTYENALEASRCGVGYYLASQDLVLGDGWRYDTVLHRATRAISSGEGLSPKKFSQIISDHFVELGDIYRSFAAVELESLHVVQEKIDRLASAILDQGGLKHGSVLRKIWDTPRPAELTDLSDLVDLSDLADLGDLAYLFARGTRQGPIYDAAIELMWSLESRCHHRWRSFDAKPEDMKTGLNIYAPASSVSALYAAADADWCKGRWSELLATIDDAPAPNNAGDAPHQGHERSQTSMSPGQLIEEPSHRANPHGLVPRH